MLFRRAIPAAGLATVLAASGYFPIAAEDAKPAFRIPNRAGEDKPGEREGKLKPGDMAADFTLNVMHRETAVTLSAFRGARPVALIFGSYT